MNFKEENVNSINILKMLLELNVLSSWKFIFVIYFDIDGSWGNEKYK